MKSILAPLRLITASLLFIFVIASCQKETSGNGSDEEQQVAASRASSEADGEAESVFDGLFDDAYGANDEVGLSGTGVFWGRSDSLTPVPRCFTVTVVRLSATAPFPVRLIMDFGTTGCVGPDGHSRKGKIITTYTNRLTIPEATATTTFENFFVDNVKVEGTHKITNTSPVIPSVPPVRRFTIDVTDGKLTRPDGNYTEWTSHKTINQIEGLITPNDPRDDVFRIEGTGHGRTLRGTLLVTWESNIVEPLIRRFSCRWIVKGRIRTVRTNLPATSPWIAVLDFGTGGCDNAATLTINGNTYNITLR